MATYQELCIFASTLAEISGRGKQRQRPGNGWTTCCPAHDDDTPSLDIFVEERINFKCYAGCEEEAIVEAYRALGVQEIPQPTRYKANSGDIEINRVAHAPLPEDEWLLGRFEYLPDHIYTYKNKQGDPVFFVTRLDAKKPDISTKQVKPVCSAKARSGGLPFWISQAYPPSLRRPLYNLYDLVCRPEAPVLVVEGEKAADAAARLLPGYVAMTWAGGASGLKSSDWAPLNNRHVTLWPDNDEAGIKAMREVASVIGRGRHAAKSIRLVLEEVSDSFPAKWDLGDPYLEEYTPIDFVLERAGDIDPASLADKPLPADDEEVAERLAGYLEKYAVMTVGPKHHYIDLTNRSPFTGEMIPYAYHEKSTLQAIEADMYIVGQKTKRRFIDDFIESSKKKWLYGLVYDPSSEEKLVETNGRYRLNLYCGFAHPACQCDSKLYQCFIDHIYASCATKAEGDYILDWFATKFQHPEQMLGTMIILSGRQGCGKTIICDIVRKIMGRHNAVQIGMNDLASQFNSQYANKLLIDVEEYDPLSTKAHREYREKVKNLITARSIIINTKNLPAFENSTYHNIIATTNSQTPEPISFDNRRMTFIRFDNKELESDGRLILNKAYFEPLVNLLNSPVALSGLCYYLSHRKIDIATVMVPLDTEMTKEALTFVDDPVLEFLRHLADTGVLPVLDEMPGKDNPYPIMQWPMQACVLPRSVLNEMFRNYAKEFRHEIITPSKASRMLLRALMVRSKKGKDYRYPRGISEDYKIDQTHRWAMVSTWRATDWELVDRALCLPDLEELRFMLDDKTGTNIKWSVVTGSAPVEGSNVLDFPGKKSPDDEPQF